jgi:starch phosphorylase
VLVNGGINLSELDGWWAEAYSPAVGWAIGDGQEHGDDPYWDAGDAEALYTLLEREVIPQFYARDENGIPAAWVARMRESMARLTPFFSANRAVREYAEHYYLPAAAAFRSRAADKGEEGVKLVNWSSGLRRNWSRLRFGPVEVVTRDGQHIFEAQVYLGEIDPDHVSVEVYAEGVDGGAPLRLKAKQTALPIGEGCVSYVATAPSTRPPEDYTFRIIPNYRGAAIPLEAAHILWQR